MYKYISYFIRYLLDNNNKKDIRISYFISYLFASIYIYIYIYILMSE